MTRTRAAASYLMLAGAVLLVATAAICGGSGDTENDEAPLPSTTPFSVEQQSVIHEIRDGISDIRGLSPAPDIVEGTITRETIKAYYEAEAGTITDEEREELETYNKVFRMLRIIGPDDDLLALSSEFYGEGSAGFYSFDEEKLVLVGDGSDLSYDDKSTLAHEYVHSFQGAAFDFDRFEELAEEEDEDDNGAPTEYGITTGCLIEGDAELSQFIYEDRVLGEEPPGDPADDAAAQDLVSRIPPGFLRYVIFNYNECALFAISLWVDGGRDFDKIDAAYRIPPWTTEQIMHPEKYDDRESVTGMKPLDLSDRLGDGWDRLESALYGEFDLYNYIATVLENEDVAKQAAAGWGVGWIGLYEHEGDEETHTDDRIVVYVALEFDTRAEFDEFAYLYGGVIDRLGGASVTRAPDGSYACWSGGTESAYVAFNAERKRADIVMATDDDALRAAASERLSSGTSGTCPGW